MRPLRLQVEGFTSFRERVDLDFSGLDLFAITGPTGAGKSSLIDALVFALYGQVPRVGKEYKQLISHGAEKLSVCLDFQVGGRSYRVARVTRMAGASPTRLERLENGLAIPLGDRVKDIQDQVEAIVGLDYDAFTRSVVLPQGQFDAFLKGEPRERRKILVALLKLGTYEQMHAIVNRKTADAKKESAFIAGQLAVDFAGATPEAIETMQRELADAESRTERLVVAQASLETGVRAAERVRTARRDLATLSRSIDDETARKQEADATVSVADKARRKREASLAEATASLNAGRFDEGRFAVLMGARPRAQQLDKLAPMLVRFEVEKGGLAQALEAKRSELRAAEERAPRLGEEQARQQAAAEMARERLDGLRRQHAAHDLRRHLKVGEPCLVCEQVVSSLPVGGGAGLAEADAAVKAAVAAAERSRRDHQEAALLVERLRGDVRGTEAQVDAIGRQMEDARRSARAEKEALEAAGFAPLEIADPHDLAGRIQLELGSLEEAKAKRDSLESTVRKLEAERAKHETAAAGARAQAEAAATRLQALMERLAQSQAALDEATRALVTMARQEGWELGEASVSGRDEAELLAERRTALQGEVAILAGRREGARKEVEFLEKAVARVAELSEKKRELDTEAALAGTLALHLKADQFLAYVQEEALLRLAADGSGHLRILSQGRYSLACDDQEFSVIDHWNGDMRRSVKTLSGGETFLASLALALALAESLAQLSAEGRAGEALESLFLDEGFGTLDPETLDLVVQALDALHGGNRMVGVITHLAELAERLPARVAVSRSDRGAQLAIS